GYFIEGMREAGMAATGKHFPGHGGVVADSHLETPTDTRSLEALWEHDLRPFKALMPSLQGIMPAHIVFPNIHSRAVGFSSYWLQDILRGELGFKGVIFSDDLSMKGADVAGGYRQKAEQALAAGCDMVLVCNNREGALIVADYLNSAVRLQTDSRRLGVMRARQHWSWAGLAASERRASVADQLARITVPR
ncbi:MAG TPA: beta-N-acetylhexosaminidase, partial [Porticoccaceae bacterium]|nr:beta-N-acetylhexosaminidase [Porticoccaceae bacterium]